MNTLTHPGPCIRDQVIPPTMPVKEAAKRLGVGRPALSNLLNGNAALSPEMAARLQKVFGADQQQLLKLQAKFDQQQQRSLSQKLAVGAYVPPFLKITVRDIEHWVDGNLEARSLIPVLLRKLVNSTSQDTETGPESCHSSTRMWLTWSRALPRHMTGRPRVRIQSLSSGGDLGVDHTRHNPVNPKTV